MSLDREVKSQLSPEFKLSETGTVEAVFSTFGVVDRDGDIVTRQALVPYDGQQVTMVANHDWSVSHWIGKGRMSIGTKHATFKGQFFLNTQAGRDAYEVVKELQGVSEWSWSFLPGDVAYEERDGKQIRVIKSLAEPPFEVSPVLLGAGLGTRTLAVKSALLEAIHDQSFIKELRADLLKELKQVRDPDDYPDQDEPKQPDGDDGDEVVVEPMPEEGDEAAEPIPAPDGEGDDEQERVQSEAVKQEVPAHLAAAIEDFLRWKQRIERGE